MSIVLLKPPDTITPMIQDPAAIEA